jgi:hypothetical protein
MYTYTLFMIHFLLVLTMFGTRSMQKMLQEFELSLENRKVRAFLFNSLKFIYIWLDSSLVERALDCFGGTGTTLSIKHVHNKP